MIIILALLAFIGGMAWVAVNVTEGAFAPMIAGLLLLPFAIVGVWMTR